MIQGKIWSTFCCANLASFFFRQDIGCHFSSCMSWKNEKRRGNNNKSGRNVSLHTSDNISCFFSQEEEEEEPFVPFLPNAKYVLSECLHKRQTPRLRKYLTLVVHIVLLLVVLVSLPQRHTGRRDTTHFSHRHKPILSLGDTGGEGDGDARETTAVSSQ